MGDHTSKGDTEIPVTTVVMVSSDGAGPGRPREVTVRWTTHDLETRGGLSI